MKIRNKKTGEIGELHFEPNKKYHFTVATEDPADMMIFKTLAELNDKWEDYEEPEGWCVTMYGGITHIINDDLINDLKEIGNFFETKEDAYDALDRLKAWKRLKDKGFRFEGWERDERYCGDFTIMATDQTSCDNKDLDLLFGGEE